MKQIHHVCPNCGWYGGREAVRIKVKKEAGAS
jgi:ribosomal protein L32